MSNAKLEEFLAGFPYKEDKVMDDARQRDAELERVMKEIKEAVAAGNRSIRVYWLTSHGPGFKHIYDSLNGKKTFVVKTVYDSTDEDGYIYHRIEISW